MISSYQQEEELYYMEQKKNLVTLGSTGITVEKNSFGALPIQRISKEAAIGLLHKAYAAGVTFMILPDTIPTVKKVGAAFEGYAGQNIYRYQDRATTTEGFWKELHTSLEKLKQIILISTSSTTRHSARSRETAQDSMRLCWKQRTKA